MKLSRSSTFLSTPCTVVMGFSALEKRTFLATGEPRQKEEKNSCVYKPFFEQREKEDSEVKNCLLRLQAHKYFLKQCWLIDSIFYSYMTKGVVSTILQECHSNLTSPILTWTPRCNHRHISNSSSYAVVETSIVRQ